MKKLLFAALFGTVFLFSCAQKEEKREEFKAEHDKDFKRNAGVDSAALYDKEKLDSLQTQP